MLYPILTNGGQEFAAQQIMKTSHHKETIAPIMTIPTRYHHLRTDDKDDPTLPIFNTMTSKEFPIFQGVIFATSPVKSTSTHRSFNNRQYHCHVFRDFSPVIFQLSDEIPDHFPQLFYQHNTVSDVQIPKGAHFASLLKDCRKWDRLDDPVTALDRVFSDHERIRKAKNRYDRNRPLADDPDYTPTKREKFTLWLKVREDIPVLAPLHGKVGRCIKQLSFAYLVQFDKIFITDTFSFPLRLHIRAEYCTPVL